MYKRQANAYYNNENSLILSARIDERRIETVEVDLRTLKVVQSLSLIHISYRREDIPLKELNLTFINDFEYFLRTEKKCRTNTCLLYTSRCV